MKTYSPDKLRAMIKKGDYTPTKPDAPVMTLDEKFWQDARIVMPGEGSKVPVSVRLDPDVYDWFKGTGKGYLSRINAVLKAFVESQKKQHS